MLNITEAKKTELSNAVNEQIDIIIEAEKTHTLEQAKEAREQSSNFINEILANPPVEEEQRIANREKLQKLCDIAELADAYDTKERYEATLEKINNGTEIVKLETGKFYVYIDSLDSLSGCDSNEVVFREDLKGFDSEEAAIKYGQYLIRENVRSDIKLHLV